MNVFFDPTEQNNLFSKRSAPVMDIEKHNAWLNLELQSLHINLLKDAVIEIYEI